MTSAEELATLARGAALTSYSPYSGFRVGAVVVGPAGEVFTGANVENAAYPASSCAEATAINTAVAQGLRKIDTVAVACIDAADVDGSYPCGRCRQIMSEFDVEIVIVTAGDGSEVRTHTLGELLPHRFGL
ncbi:MAG: cytidine deaminase [Actinobacteria bacterium]|nr:cytidine deaminase [Actinomycetota bacterium]MCI0678785.1 cytidine deaminase [Actinomycetota bacterium]